MLTDQQARTLVGQWLSSEVDLRDSPMLAEVIDAHVHLSYPVPQTLLDAFAEDLQKSAPPNVVVKVENYLGRIRVLQIKAKAAAQWAARPPEEYD